MKKILFYFLMITYTNSCFAGLWPVITSIKTVKLNDGNNGYNYYITQKLFEIGSAVDVVEPNKYILLTHRHNPKTWDTIGSPKAQLATNNSETISTLALRLYNNSGKDVAAVYHANGDDPTNSECVAYIVSPDTAGSWSSVYVPGGCLVVPPASEWCKITTPELLLDHGVISLQEAEGSTVTGQIGLQCTTPTAVTFNLMTNDKYLYLDEGKAEITVNDLPLKTKINLPKGSSTMPIKDVLTGVTKEGFHTGSSVLVMMPY